MSQTVSLRRLASTPEERAALWAFIQESYPDLAELLQEDTVIRIRSTFDAIVEVDIDVAKAWRASQPTQQTNPT